MATVAERAVVGRTAVLADDLSGAAESAAALLPRGLPVTVVLGPAHEVPADRVVVVDTNTRAVAPSEARDAVHRLDRALGTALLVKKIDSLLRGNVAAEVEALLGEDRAVVLTPASPASGRVVRDGVVYVEGMPLAETTLWAVEAEAPPHRVSDVLAGVPVTEVPLAVLRGGGLADLLGSRRSGARSPRAVYCVDAITDADLDLVVAAALAAPGVRLAGSAALVAAVARAGGNTGADRATEPPGPARPGPLLVVAGSASEQARRQVDVVVAAGIPCTRLDGRGLARGERLVVGNGDSSRWPRLLTITPAGPLTADEQERLTAGLADAAVEWIREQEHPVDLLLTGGATARAVLDRLGIRRLDVLQELIGGAVLAMTPDGVHVTTRPGSYGDDSCLLDLIRLTGGPAVLAQKIPTEKGLPR